MSEIILGTSPAKMENTQIREPRVSEGSDTEYDQQFKPIVSLPEVELLTNEENETVLLKMRAKLYRFDTASDPSEWKERGTGEMKMLQNKDNFAIRIVMRRDKTFKVCANHFITPWMKLQPCSGSEKAFIYTVAADFADELPKSECLAIKFGSIDNANLFKSKFEESKELLLTKCSLYNGEGDKEQEEIEEKWNEEETKEVADKLAELNVSKDSVCEEEANEKEK